MGNHYIPTITTQYGQAGVPGMNLDFKFKDVLKQTNEQQTLEKSQAICMLLLNMKKKGHHLIISRLAFVFLSVLQKEKGTLNGRLLTAVHYAHHIPTYSIVVTKPPLFLAH